MCTSLSIILLLLNHILRHGLGVAQLAELTGIDSHHYSDHTSVNRALSQIRHHGKSAMIRLKLESNPIHKMAYFLVLFAVESRI